MKSLKCTQYGHPSLLSVQDGPDLHAAPGTVVVDVAAAAVNFPDVLMVANQYQTSIPVPFTPGSEFAGLVRDIGADVTGWAPGDRVMGAGLVGAFAEQIVVESGALSRIPSGLDFVHAAAFRVTYTTAYHSLVTAADIKPGEWVVVLGAAGGVGSAMVDVAVRLGARVVACASGPDRLAVAARLGADALVDYAIEDLKHRIRSITGGGAHVVVDPVGGDHAEQALRAIRWGGRFVTVGFASGEIPRIPLNLVLLKNVTVSGMELRSWVVNLPEAVAKAQTELEGMVAEGMRPFVSATYPFMDGARALVEVAERRAVGKTVLIMSD